MSDETHVEVLIVGGGPAGLATASRLGSGVRSVLVHQDAEIGLPVRTSGGCWLSEVERLGIPEKFWHRLSHAMFYSDSHQISVDLASEPCVIFDVTGLYQWLAESSKAEIRLNTKCLSVTRDGLGYRAKMRGPDRAEYEITCDYIVDASGWQSVVWTSLGFGTVPERKGVGHELEYPIGSFEPGRGVLIFGSAIPTGYGWAFPTTKGTVRLGVGVIQPETDASPRDLMQMFLKSDLFKATGLPVPKDAETHAGILPSERFQGPLVMGRAIRLGDCANMATPILGEGIRHAIEQGRKLGWVLKAELEARDGKALRRWDRQAKSRFGWQYRVGFEVNSRAARYGPEDWDRSLQRMERLPDADLIRFLKNDLPASMIARRLGASVWRRLSGR